MDFLESNENAKDYVEGFNYFQESIRLLQNSAKEVEDLLTHKRIKHTLIGGVALSFYNTQRGTEDLDYIVDVDYEELKEKTFGKIRFFSERRAVYLPTKTPIDFIYVGDKNGNHKVIFPKTNIIKGVEVVTLKDLIKLKLIANRHRDIGDIEQLIRNNNLERDYIKVTNYIDVWDKTIKMSDDEIERIKFMRGL